MIFDVLLSKKMKSIVSRERDFDIKHQLFDASRVSLRETLRRH